ncbi:amidase [Baekduia soli]|nr:amidase [Baekduia soli]
MELHERTATDLHDLVAGGAVAVQDVVDALVARIDALEHHLRAWTAVERGCADRGGAGPLHGVPVGIKDNIDTADLPTTYGSRQYAGHRPGEDAHAVALLRDAGGLVLGKTELPEFAAVQEPPPPTRNPHDPTRTPGGSSSGSAAAVAAGMVPVALGTQTTGSVVRPASFCGIFGFKPTFGSIATAGVRRITTSLDTVGVLARSVADVELLTGILAGTAPVAAPAAPRIGLLRTALWDAADPCTRDAMDAVAARIADAGADVEELELDPGAGALGEAAPCIQHVEMASLLADEPYDALADALRGMLDAGRATSPAAYAEAQDLVARWRPRVDERLRRHEAVLTPSVLGEAPGAETTGDPLFCRTWTLLGTPAMSMPLHRSPAGLPVGLQLVAPRGADAALLATARWVAERLLDDGRVAVVEPAAAQRDPG